MSGRWKPSEPGKREPHDSGISVDRLSTEDGGSSEVALATAALATADAASEDGSGPSSSQAASGPVATSSRPPSYSRPSPALSRPATSQSRSGAPSRRLSSQIPQPEKEVHLSGNAPSFLDKLFTTLATLRSDAPLEEAIGALLDAFMEVFDDVAVGVCIAADGGSQMTVRRSPRDSILSIPNPSRLFSEFDNEWVIDLGAGSTLHVSTDDEGYVASLHSPSERLGMAVRSVLDRTRALDVLRTERRETEQLRLQIIHSEKLASLGQIAAGIVHELNNPLTSILAYSDYLRRDWEKRGISSADTERLRRINEAAERILTFTRDLIAYSRPTASVPGPVDVHEVLDRALVFCEHVITTNKIVVDKTFGKVRLVSGVAGQLTQVFVNLITNACQAMKEDGGTLWITSELNADETKMIVSVADQGHGILPEHMERLFEPYFTTKVDGGGTGLGLPIVQNIVTSHGGCISAKNQALGAVFTVELPLSARVTLFDEA